MPRYILDIDNLDIEKTISKIDKLDIFNNNVSTIVCIDTTNNNQFHENQNENFLSIKQLKNYDSFLGENNLRDIFTYNNFIVSSLLHKIGETEEKGLLEITPIAIKLLQEFMDSKYLKLDKSHYDCIELFLKEKGY